MVFALSFSPADASEEHLVVDLPYPAANSLARAPSNATVEQRFDHLGSQHPHLQA